MQNLHYPHVPLLTRPCQGHHLWNAGRTIADHLEQHSTALVANKTVLELGAGAGLPSLVCALNGASTVVVSDYPDADLIDNLQYNIDTCALLPQPARVFAEGFLWGAGTERLLKHLSAAEGKDGEEQHGFDVLILADLLFNHSEHGRLIATVQQTLKRTAEARALVFFTPYRPWLLQKDLAFFDLARQAGFVVEQILKTVMDKVMFEEDPGVSAFPFLPSAGLDCLVCVGCARTE